MKMNIKKSCLITAILFSTMSFLHAQNESQEAENLIKKSQEALTAKNYIDASKTLQKAKEEVTKLLSDQLALSLPAIFDNWLPVNDSKTANSPGMPMGMPMGMPGSSDMSCIRIYEMEQKGENMKETSAPPALKNDQMPVMNPPPAMPPTNPPAMPPAMPAGTPPAMPPPMPTGMPGGMPAGMPPTMNMAAMGMDNQKPRIIVTISNNASVAANVAYINSGSNASPMMSSPMGSTEDTKAIKIKNYRAMSKYNKMMKSGEVAVIIGAGVVQVQGTNIENIDMLQKFADQIDYLKIKAVFGE